MPKITINNTVVDVTEGTTVLQACEQLGFEIPVFCYHPRLSIAGNCRMCLVELEKSPKPIASCAMPAAEGMVVHTNTPLVKKARQGVLEFLLINHPLDCPICDQGGECDLQDITLHYSRGESRFELNKRAVDNKYMGPLIKTVMNRCIHCTRCIRFCNEIAGVEEMGAVGRGEHTEITSYLEKTISSELSGNLIDICPVGALTNKPYAFHGRPWELTKTETIDVMDAVGSHIRVDSRGAEILRVLPRLNDDINEEWIHDKTRFSYDGLKRQRLDRPYVRDEKGKLQACTWEHALQTVAKKLYSLPPSEIGALVGNQADCESIMALKDLMVSLGTPHMDCRQEGEYLDSSNRSSYLFNTTIAGIEQADVILLIATNPRTEAPLINARIRKNYVNTGLPIGLVGAEADLSYPYTFLGDQAPVVKDIFEGNHPFSKVLSAAKRPLMIVGQGALTRRDSRQFLRLCQSLAEKYNMIQPQWIGFNILHTAAARVGALDLGFTPLPPHGLDTPAMLAACQQNKIKAVYLLGADELSMAQLGDAFVIYQGHHGDAGAHRADVILPGCAFTEKTATYVNTEGRPQEAIMAISPPGEAKEDWRIIRALSDYVKAESLDQASDEESPNKGKAAIDALPYDDLTTLRKRLQQVNPIFKFYNVVTSAEWKLLPLGTPETLSQLPFRRVIDNFYMTDPISRHSAIMASCAAELKEIKGGDHA